MSSTSNRANGDVIRDFLSVADLLEEPQLAQLYAYLAREGETTVGELMEALDLAQGTAYTYVNQLVDTGVLEATTDGQPRTYTTRDIDLTITTTDSGREYTITAALVMPLVDERLTKILTHTSIGMESLDLRRHSLTPSTVNVETLRTERWRRISISHHSPLKSSCKHCVQSSPSTSRSSHLVDRLRTSRASIKMWSATIRDCDSYC